MAIGKKNEVSAAPGHRADGLRGPQAVPKGPVAKGAEKTVKPTQLPLTKPAKDSEDLSREDEELDYGVDPQENHVALITLFETKWKPLEYEHTEDHFVEKVAEFIEKHAGKDIYKGLDLTGFDDDKPLLQRVPLKPLRSRGPVSLDQLFQRRCDLIRWLMYTYSEIHKPKSGDDGYPETIIEMVLKRTKRPNAPPEFQRFIQFFIHNYPKQTADLLMFEQAEAAEHGNNNRDPLVHQLLRTRDPELPHSSGLIALLRFLDADTVLELDHEENTVLHIATKYDCLCDESDEAQSELLESIEILLSKAPGALKSVNKKGQSPYQYRITTYEQLAPKVPHNDQRLPLSNDPIASLLKDRYMHFGDRRDTIRYLHGDVQEYEIHVNLEELSRTSAAVSKENIQELFKNLKLENILQYVRIPRYRLEATAKTHASKKIPRGKIDPPGAGLRDYEQIFDLLWVKEVRKIIKIVVEDHVDTPHSDEMLETLQRFQIEEWDWKRTDLCSSVLFNAAPDARALTLYSSGSSAVLRSWSGTDGLNQFKRLKEIKVFIHQHLESLSRVQAYKEEFLRRMVVNCPSIVVDATIVQRNTRGKQVTTQTLFEAEERATAWLNTMNNFSRFIANLPEEADRGPGIKVALLDDGIDGMHGDFHSNLKGGISFFTGNNENDRHFFFSSIGHGTLMAHLIRQVCPKVQLYVARLNQYPSADGMQMQPTPESAAQAIHWAIKKGVDIISMSWSITKTANNKSGIQLLEKALLAAKEANILMFSAASDQGYNETNQVWPSSARSSGVFCIGAAKGSGQVEDVAEKEAEYVFPGSGGPMRTPKLANGEKATAAEIASSSSFATALAAGMAALVLYCTDLTEIMPDEKRKLLRNAAVMKAIFNGMGTKGYRKYIAVKKYFPQEFAELDWYEGATQQKLHDAVKKILRPYTDNFDDY